ncbi:MAG: recombinase RecT [Anaerolineales bacterium]
MSKLKTSLAITPSGVVLPETMQQVTEFAQYMAKADRAIPAHLRENPGACMSVIMDSISWGMNPFSVARMHMVVTNKHGVETGSYMAQLITAVINRHAPIKGRLVPLFEGDGQQLRCILRPVTVEGQELPYESPIFSLITPKNSPLWTSDPRQQLGYYSTRGWARRYFPDLLLGVYDPEEAATMMKDITPEVDNMLVDRPVNDPSEPLARPLVRGQPFDDDGMRWQHDRKAVEESIAEARERGQNGDGLQKPAAVIMDEVAVSPGAAGAAKASPDLLGRLLKNIAGAIDSTSLKETEKEALAALPDMTRPEQKIVRKALADKAIELDF